MGNFKLGILYVKFPFFEGVLDLSQNPGKKEIQCKIYLLINHRYII